MGMHKCIDIHVKRREIDRSTWNHNKYSLKENDAVLADSMPGTVIEYKAEMVDDRLLKTGRVNSNEPTWITHKNENAPNLVRVDNEFFLSLEVASSVGDLGNLTQEYRFGPSRSNNGWTSRSYLKVNKRVIRALCNFEAARASDYQLYRAEEIRNFGKILKMMVDHELDNKAPRVERDDKSVEEAARENIERVQSGVSK